jgi:hypothetical protein
MSSLKKVSPAIITILALVFSLSTASFAKEKYSKFPNVKIKNFGQMDDRFFRGARPKDEDYQRTTRSSMRSLRSRLPDCVTSTFRWLIRVLPAGTRSTNF